MSIYKILLSTALSAFLCTAFAADAKSEKPEKTEEALVCKERSPQEKQAGKHDIEGDEPCECNAQGTTQTEKDASINKAAEAFYAKAKAAKDATAIQFTKDKDGKSIPKTQAQKAKDLADASRASAVAFCVASKSKRTDLKKTSRSLWESSAKASKEYSDKWLEEIKKRVEEAESKLDKSKNRANTDAWIDAVMEMAAAEAALAVADGDLKSVVPDEESLAELEKVVAEKKSTFDEEVKKVKEKATKGEEILELDKEKLETTAIDYIKAKLKHKEAQKAFDEQKPKSKGSSSSAYYVTPAGEASHSPAGEASHSPAGEADSNPWDR